MRTQNSGSRIFGILSLSLILTLVFLILSFSAEAADTSDNMEKGISFYERGDFDRAIREFRQITSELKDRPEDETRNEGLFTANFYLGMCYLGKGKESLAKEAFKNAFKAAPHKTLSSEQYPPKVILLYNEVISQSLSSLTVKSNVREAEVFVDDSKKGNTPVVIRNLLPGMHTVKVSAPALGGQEVIKTVNLESGKDMAIVIDFQTTGTISVTSEPSAATVYIDGKMLGETPLLIKNIVFGEHTLNVSKSGYIESSQKIIVKKDESTDINVRLNPVTYSVRLMSVPDNAEVLWDEASKGTTPLILENVSPGMHKIRIAKEGYEEQKDALDIKTPVTEKTYRLNPYTGSLAIKSEPAGAEIIIDNISVGTTPLNVSALPVKQYLVKFRKNGYKEKDISVIVAKDKISEINEMLLEIDTQKPEIIYEPLTKAIKENKNFIRARIIDNQAVGDVSLMLKMEGEINFQGIRMSSPLKGIYEAAIPETYLKKGATLEYYITACDLQNNCETSGNKEAPYKLKVISLEPYTEGFILDIDGSRNKVTISLGSVDGVKKEDRYVVFRPGKELRDPKTGELLQIEETFIGTIEVKELMPRTAYAIIENIVIQVAKDDRIRKQVSAPTGLTTEGTYVKKIVLKWAPNREPEVRGYHIFKSLKSDGKYRKIGEVDGRDNTQYEDTDEMKEGLCFYYRIAAFNIFDADGLMSEPVIGLTKKGVLPPENIRIEGVKIRQVHLRWSLAKQDPDMESYIIYRAESEAGQFAAIAQTDKEADNYLDKENLKDGGNYYYKIAGKSRYGAVGELSKTIFAATKPKPKAPLNIIAESGLARKAVLKWNKNEEKDIAEYWIYKGTAAGLDSSPLAKVKANVNIFTDSDLKDGLKYFYAVRAVDADGLEGDSSNTVSAVTKPLPKAPVGLKVQTGKGKISLKWEPNKEPDVKGYNVYKKGWLKSTVLLTLKENACEVKLEDKTKSIKLYITATDKDGLESEPSEEIEINLQ